MAEPGLLHHIANVEGAAKPSSDCSNQSVAASFKEGRLTEWFKVPDLKSGGGNKNCPPQVQILCLPPFYGSVAERLKASDSKSERGGKTVLREFKSHHFLSCIPVLFQVHLFMVSKNAYVASLTKWLALQENKTIDHWQGWFWGSVFQHSESFDGFILNGIEGYELWSTDKDFDGNTVVYSAPFYIGQWLAE